MTNIDETRNTPGFFLSHLKRLFHWGLDLIFPPSCIHCGKVDTYFCNRCIEQLSNEPIVLTLNAPNALLKIASTGIHQGILQSSVIGLKYHGMLEVAPILAQRMVAILPELDWTIDTIIPVPLHTARLRERGYNQAKEISEHLAHNLQILHLPDAIQRQRETHTQVGLNREERLHNMKEAFFATNDLQGRHLLLIDDVQTTGATLTACAEVAIKAGATAVYAITVTAASN